ncbi:MAG: diguanylate cyclase [Betaproteobacteria bacterium]|nr:diguanylate cyclase [Betaproteobacteria bacterium]
MLLDLIENQLIANRLPLVAVSLAAVPHSNTPTVLTLHWHGFVEVKLSDESETVAYQPVPSSALQVNERWDRLNELDYDALETAWELGAWNLERVEARPFVRPGADSGETIAGMHAFGVSPLAIEGDSPFVADVPDGDDLIDAAGRSGYVQWLFRPVRGGLWSEVADDLTLEPGGYRNPPCPLLSEAPQLRQSGRERRWNYQFGRSNKLGFDRRAKPAEPSA